MKNTFRKLLSVLLVVLMVFQTFGFVLADGSEPTASLDGRVSAADGLLVVPGGNAVTYTTAQSFSGDYTVEMRAAIDFQAVGLLIGNNTAKPALWCLAAVDPFGIWIHQRDTWSVNKVADADVALGTMVDLKVEITGTTAKTYINGDLVSTDTMTAGFAEGPLGLRFSKKEAGKIEYVKVTQNGKVIFNDDFDKLDGFKWNIPTESKVVYETNLAKAASTNSNNAATQYFRPAYLVDGVITCGGSNHGYSSLGLAGADTSANPVVITLDLGGHYAFNQLVLYPRDSAASTVAGESSPNYPVDFTVETSHNGSDWKLVKTVTNNPNPDGAAQSINLDETAEGRYVRLNITRVGHLPSGETTYYVQLAEIEVFNRETILPDPADVTSYTIDFDFRIDSDNQGFCFGMSGAGTFVMWQVSTYESTSTGGNSVLLRPHFKANNSWTAYPGGPGNVEAVDISETIGYAADTIEGKVIHERIEVDGTTIKTYFGPDADNLTLANTYVHSETVPLRKIGFRHSCSDGSKETEVASYDNIVVKDFEGNVFYDMNFDNGSVGFTSTNGVAAVKDGWLQIGSTVAGTGEQVYTMIETGEAFTNIPYASNSATQLLDVHLPVGEGPHPVVVYFHGGAWLIGDKADTPESQNVLDTLVGKGYAVVSVNYRLASEAKWPAQIYDCKAAVRWVRANAEQYGFDTEKIVAFGSSAGAHLALMTGLTNGNADMEDLSMGNAECSSDVMAVISNYGISDLTKWNYRESLFSWLGDPNVALLGENYTEEQALAASPITYVSSNSVPVLLCHGQNDTLVEPYHSSDLAEAIIAANGVSKVDTYYPANGPHGDGTFWNGAEPTKAITDFLAKWFNPHVTLNNGDNNQAFSNVDLKTWPNATTMLKYADDSNSQVLHIVTPEVGTGPFPTIVFIHGGGFTGLNSSNGSIYWVGRAALEATKHGFAAAFVDYRLSGEAKYPAPVHDIKTAIRYLRANADTYKLDTERFAIWGESAGGHLCSFVALTSGDPAYEDLSMGYADYSSDIQACVSWYPITNLPSAYNNSKGWTKNLMGFAAGTDVNSDNYKACWDASPVAQASAGDCPVYLQHGMADTLVEYQDSIDLYNALVAVNDPADYRLELFPGLIHGPGGKFLSEDNLNAVYAWLNDKLDVPELTEDQLAARAVDNLISAIGDKITRDSEDAILAARDAYEALTAEGKAAVTMLAQLEAAEAALIKLFPATDGRVSAENGYLVVPGGNGVTYTSIPTFSGDYTVEMRAAIDFQAVGLMVGNGNANPALWCLAAVDPFGIWIHQPGNWKTINKVADSNVALGSFVDLKVEISGTTAKTYINGTLVSTDTMPAGFSAGPLALRFSNKEAGKIDYVKVTQNGEVVFRDDFNYLNSANWSFVVDDYNVNLALGKTVTANSDVNMPQYFAVKYLTDGVTACGNGNFGYSSKAFGSADISANPVTITVDLGAAKNFNHVVIHPRTDVDSTEGNSPSFLKDFTIKVSSDNSKWETIYVMQDNEIPNDVSQGHAFETVNARYIQITTTEVGPHPTDGPSYYLQLAEVEVFNRENLALGKAVATNSDVGNKYFKPAYLTDGVIESDPANLNYGYSSKANATSGIVAAVNLGEMTTINQVVLYPRTDVKAADGGAANFPTNFVIQYSTGGMTNADFITVDTITNGRHDSNTGAYIYSFDDVDAVWIRVVVNGVSGAAAGETAAYVQISEMEVYNRAAVDQPDPVKRDFADLPYANQSTRQKLDIHLPDGEGPFPVVIYYHGGAWLIGDKAAAPEAQGILDAIVNKGYAVVCANYRYASEAQWPAQIYDCKAAIRYVRAHAEEYSLDADRIAVFGASAGAHLALMTGLTNGMAQFEDLSMGNAEYSSDVMAIVSNYGISDLTKWNYRESLFGAMGDPIEKLLGANWTEEAALAASPITYVNENSVPVYLAHGQNDTLVEPYHSTDLEAALKAVVDPELVDTYYPANGPHANQSVWNGTDSITNILAFLQKRFEPHVPLTNGDNFRAFGSLDLNTYPNATLNVQYANNSTTQKLHVVTPDGEGPFPTIVFIHGGGFGGGNSSGGKTLYTSRGPIQALEDGYAVAFVDYRCGGEAKYPAPVHDIKAAIRYLRANAETLKLDADRFAIWGESAGGHLASFVAVTSNKPAFEDLSMGNADYSSAVQACVAWYPITNLTTARNQQYAPTLMGFNATTNYDACWNASPVAQVTEDVCPFYLQHGLADNEVEYQDSIQLYNLIKEAGQENVKLDLFPGINHATKKFLDEKNVDKLIVWLNETLVDPDVEAAANVDALIEAIGEVTVDSGDKIAAARAAYDALTDDGKALVTKLDVLKAAEAAYEAAVQAAADKAAAEAVDTLIAAIGEVTVESGDKITAARTAYDALTEARKALVTKLAVLEAAEEAYKALQSPADGTVTLILSGADNVSVEEESVTYTLSAKGMNALANAIVAIDLDETYLTDPTVTVAEGWYLIAHTWKNGVLNVAVGNLNGANGDGDILTVTAKPTGEKGSATVAVTYTELCAYDGEGEVFVNADLSQATVTTDMTFNPYDVNKDGVVDQLDMTRAQRYYNTNNADADVNDDNLVDIVDLILILQNYHEKFAQ